MPHPVTTQEFMLRFQCLGAECEDTCCQGWSMQVDDYTYDKYNKAGPDLLDAVSGEPGKYSMRRDPKTGFCVKFDNGLCGIQKKYGAGMLGEACYFYPRILRSLGDTDMMTGTLSCPEVARLSLFSGTSFEMVQGDIKSLLADMKNYLPGSLSTDQAVAIHKAFMDAALDEHASPQRSLMRIFAACESLERVSVGSWPDAVPFYLGHADSGLTPPESAPTDPVYLLQALCGLMVAAKKVNNTRLMQTISEMERALHVAIRMDDLTIVPLPDAANAAKELSEQWTKRYQTMYAPLLRRYLAMQLSLALFPFCGFGNSLSERIGIIGVRFATVRLALMSACALSAKPLDERHAIRIVQSLSRLLDHLAEPDFSLQIYNETGWLKKARLRAVVGDN